MGGEDEREPGKPGVERAKPSPGDAEEDGHKTRSAEQALQERGNFHRGLGRFYYQEGWGVHPPPLKP